MDDEVDSGPISEPVRPAGCGCVGMTLFGFVFFAAGVGMYWMMLIGPWLASDAAKDWPSTPCTISTSRVDVDRDSDGTTYRPIVAYRYHVDGVKFDSSTYDFSEASRSKSTSYEIVNNYPAGMETVCYYDPGNLSNSVLVRDFDRSIFVWLFPGIFVLMGGGVMVGAIFGKFGGDGGRRKSAKTNSFASAFSTSPTTLPNLSGSHHSAEVHPEDELDREMAGPQRLKQTASRIGTLVFLLAAGTFWNGLVGVFTYVAFTDQGMGLFRYFLMLFLLPFWLVGALFVVGFFHQLLNLLNPRVELALSEGAVPVGGTVDVAWELSGRTSAIRKLDIWMTGAERATFTRGTDTITDRKVFAEIIIAELGSSGEIEFGSRQITIPADTMHSFEGGKNNISWSIHVHAEIPWWPNVDEEFVFRVTPVAPSSQNQPSIGRPA